MKNPLINTLCLYVNITRSVMADQRVYAFWSGNTFCVLIGGPNYPSKIVAIYAPTKSIWAMGSSRSGCMFQSLLFPVRVSGNPGMNRWTQGFPWPSTSLTDALRVEVLSLMSEVPQRLPHNLAHTILFFHVLNLSLFLIFFATFTWFLRSIPIPRCKWWFLTTV